MNIIRYFNGKKIEKDSISETVVTNELISSTIARVNKRLSAQKGKLPINE